MRGDEALSLGSLPRWAAFPCGFLAGLIPFLPLGQAVPGVGPLIRLIPDGLRNSLAVWTGLLAGSLALLLRSRSTLGTSTLRRLLRSGVIALPVGLGLLVFFQQRFVRRLRLDGGARIVSVVVASSRLPGPGCLCKPQVSDEECLRQSIAPEALEKCWGLSRIRNNQLAWSAAYVLFAGGALSAYGALTLRKTRSDVIAALPRAVPERRIFLSYSSQDVEFVERLAADLRRRGVAVWKDDPELEVGESLPNEICNAIAGSLWFGIVLSPDAVASRWVRLELDTAIALEVETGAVTVLPIQCQSCEIPPALRGKKRAAFDVSYEKGLSALLIALGPSPPVPGTAGGSPGGSAR